MKYYETTIFKNDEYKNSDIIYNIFKGFDIKVLLISNELNEIGNTHFHVLLEFPKTMNDVISMMYNNYDLIVREVLSLEATIRYFMKDGKYKMYNNFVPNISDKTNVWHSIMDDIKSGLTYVQLIYKYGNVIVRNGREVRLLISNESFIKYENRKGVN